MECLPLGLGGSCGRGTLIPPSPCGSWACGRGFAGSKDSRTLGGAVGKPRAPSPLRACGWPQQVKGRCLQLVMSGACSCIGCAASVSFRSSASNSWDHFEVPWGIPNRCLEADPAGALGISEGTSSAPGGRSRPILCVHIAPGPGFLHLWDGDTQMGPTYLTESHLGWPHARPCPPATGAWASKARLAIRSHLKGGIWLIMTLSVRGHV